MIRATLVLFFLHCSLLSLKAQESIHAKPNIKAADMTEQPLESKIQGSAYCLDKENRPLCEKVCSWVHVAKDAQHGNTRESFSGNVLFPNDGFSTLVLQLVRSIPQNKLVQGISLKDFQDQYRQSFEDSMNEAYQHLLTQKKSAQEIQPHIEELKKIEPQLTVKLRMQDFKKFEELDFKARHLRQQIRNARQNTGAAHENSYASILAALSGLSEVEIKSLSANELAASYSPSALSSLLTTALSNSNNNEFLKLDSRAETYQLSMHGEVFSLRINQNKITEIYNNNKLMCDTFGSITDAQSVEQLAKDPLDHLMSLIDNMDDVLFDKDLKHLSDLKERFLQESTVNLTGLVNQIKENYAQQIFETIVGSSQLELKVQEALRKSPQGSKIKHFAELLNQSKNEGFQNQEKSIELFNLFEELNDASLNQGNGEMILDFDPIKIQEHVQSQFLSQMSQGLEESFKNYQHLIHRELIKLPSQRDVDDRQMLFLISGYEEAITEYAKKIALDATGTTTMRLDRYMTAKSDYEVVSQQAEVMPYEALYGDKREEYEQLKKNVRPNAFVSTRLNFPGLVASVSHFARKAQTPSTANSLRETLTEISNAFRTKQKIEYHKDTFRHD